MRAYRQGHVSSKDFAIFDSNVAQSVWQMKKKSRWQTKLDEAIRSHKEDWKKGMIPKLSIDDVENVMDELIQGERPTFKDDEEQHRFRRHYRQKTRTAFDQALTINTRRMLGDIISEIVNNQIVSLAWDSLMLLSKLPIENVKLNGPGTAYSHSVVDWTRAIRPSSVVRGISLVHKESLGTGPK